MKEGEAAAEDFVLETPPDLVVEVELTNADEEKPVRYGQLGVVELWLFKANRKGEVLNGKFFSLHESQPAQVIYASRVLPGVEPGNVAEAIKGVRMALTLDERTEAIERVIGKHGAMRVQDEAGTYE